MSEKKYHSLFENTTVGFAYHKIILDENNKPIDYKFLQVNPTFEKLMGLKRDDLIGKSVIEVLPGIENDPADWIGTYGKVALTGIPISFENYSELLDQWYNVSAWSPKKGDFIVNFANITERKKVEQDLKNNVKKMEVLNRIMTICNEAENLSLLLEKALSLTLELMDFTGGGIYLLEKNTKEAELACHMGLPNDFIERIKKVNIEVSPRDIFFIKGQPIFAENYPEIDPENSIKWGISSLASIPLFIKNKVIGAINIISNKRYFFSHLEKEILHSIGRDVGVLISRMVAEEKLMESEERFRKAVKNSPDYIVFIKTDGTIIDVNRLEKEFTKEMVFGQNVFNESFYESEKQCKSARKAINESINTRRTTSYEYSQIAPDGSLSYYEVRVSPFEHDNEGKVISNQLATRDVTERKKTELKLKESEQKYRNLSDELEQKVFERTKELNDSEKRLLKAQKIARLGFWDLNFITGDLYWSDETYRIFGFKPQEFVATYEKFENVVHPEDLDFVQQHVDAALQNDVKYNIDFRIVRPSGKIRYVGAQGDITRDSKGKAIRFIGTQMDITEHKITEEKYKDLSYKLDLKVIERTKKLKESEEKHRALIENLSDMILILDKDGVNVWGSPTVRQYGMEPEDAYGISVLEYTHPDDRERVKKALDYAVQHPGEIVKINGLKVISDSGEIVYLDDTFKYLPETPGINGIVVVCRDVTKEIKSKQKLKESEKFIMTALNSQRDTFFVFDPSTGNAIRWNKAFKEISGYTDEEIKAMKAPNSYYSDEDLRRAAEAIEEIDRDDTSTVQMDFITKEGNTIPFEYIGTKVIDDDDGKIKHIVSVGRDITQHIKAEQSLKESEEKFSKAFHSSPNLMAITRMVDGLFVDVNDAFITTLGYSREEFIGHTSTEINLWVNPEQRNTIVKQIREHTRVKNLEIKVNSKMGELLTMLFSGERINLNNEGFLITIATDITKRKITEQKLKESEEKYRSLFENMTSGFAYHEVIADENKKPIDYRYIEVNPAFETLTGLKASELIGKTVTEALPGTENDPADWIGKFGNVGLTGIPLIIEDYSEQIDRWYKVSGYSPKKGHFAVTFTDITERKKAEERLKESEEKFRLFAEQTNMGIFLIQNNKVKYVNEAMSKIIEYSVEEMMKWTGIDYINITHPDDLPAAMARVKKRQEGDSELPTSFVCRIITKTGKIKWIESFSKPILFQGKFADFGSVIDLTEKKEAEQELKRSIIDFRDLYEDAPNAYFSISPDKAILRCNRATVDLLGYKKEELLKMNVLDLYTDTEYGIVKARRIFQRFIAGEEIQNEELQMKRKDGASIWISLSVKATFDQDENVIESRSIVINITERIKSEEKIKNLAKFPSENLNPVLRITDEKVIYANEAAQRLLKVQDGSNVPDLLQQQITDLSSTNTRQTIDVEVEDKNYSFSIIPIEDAGYANVYGMDITERKKAEYQIFESELKFRTIFGAIPDLYFLVAEDTTILEFSGKEKELFLSPKEFLGKKMSEVLPQNVGDLLKAAVNLTLRTQKPQIIEYNLVMPDGEKHYYEARNLFFSENSVAMFIRDISDRKKSEQIIKESEKEYHEAFNMANFYKDIVIHDMSNVLQNIQSSMELIFLFKKKKDKSEKIDEMFGIIKQSVKRGVKLINNTRTLSKLENTESPIQKIEITKYLNDSIVYLRKSFQDKEIIVQLKILKKKIYVYANDLLSVVFENVLINSAKYNDNSIVHISIEIFEEIQRGVNYIRIEFRDNGFGILDANKEAIFQKGYKKDLKIRGMGIGLSLVKKIIDSYKGKIWVEDNEIGDYTKGSNFVMLLPSSDL